MNRDRAQRVAVVERPGERDDADPRDARRSTADSARHVSDLELLDHRVRQQPERHLLDLRPRGLLGRGLDVSSTCLPTRTPDHVRPPHRGQRALDRLALRVEQARLQPDEHLEARTSRVLRPQALEVGRAPLPVVARPSPPSVPVVVPSLAGDPLVGLRYLSAVRSITSAGSSGGGRLVVPAARIQPVADELLVERRLGAAGRVAVGRPEPGGVRREHLVDQDELAVREPELELRVGDDDPALGRDLGPALVQRDRDLAQPLGEPACRPGRPSPRT